MVVDSLYELNKSMMINENPLSKEELDLKLGEIKKFCKAKNNQYYMLLNRETYNITMFNIGEKAENVNNVIIFGLKECLINRGKTVSIELLNDKSAYEIWVVSDDVALVYYFFPYDLGVVQ